MSFILYLYKCPLHYVFVLNVGLIGGRILDECRKHLAAPTSGSGTPAPHLLLKLVELPVVLLPTLLICDCVLRAGSLQGM